MYASFDEKAAKNRWSISSRSLRDFADHFGPGTEQLDICSEQGRVTFISYTEKIVANNGKFDSPILLIVEC